MYMFYPFIVSLNMQENGKDPTLINGTRTFHIEISKSFSGWKTEHLKAL
jgi:hypothetical protein